MICKSTDKAAGGLAVKGQAFTYVFYKTEGNVIYLGTKLYDDGEGGRHKVPKWRCSLAKR